MKIGLFFCLEYNSLESRFEIMIWSIHFFKLLFFLIPWIIHDVPTS